MNDAKQRKRGRPFLREEDRRTYSLTLRMTKDEKTRLRLASEATGLDMSSYIRTRALMAADILIV